MSVTKLYNQLQHIIEPSRLKKDEKLSQFTYTKTGGQADILVFPTNYEEMSAVVKAANSFQVPITILGNGSNIIIKDGGIRGLVINLVQLKSVEVQGDKIIAQSGATIIQTSRIALAYELSGLEFACGIPGSVGGALYMNAGAYGGEIKDVLESALVLTKDGDLKRLQSDALALSYRSSIFSKETYYILEATFRLKSGAYKEIQAKMDELTHARESKQPLEYPSCGSVFKRPPGLFAGKLIQDSKLQGTQIGGVQVSTKHAGFMVNVDQGTATDYIALIQHVQQVVKEKFDVDLETEVRIIGEDA